MVTNFVWEMGIDWKGVQTVGGFSYLRTSLASEGAVALPDMNENDTITFRIFDVTDGATTAQVASINFLVITTAAAVQGQTTGVPLSTLQPLFSSSPDQPIAPCTAYKKTLRSWTSQAIPNPVTVTVPQGRFLLTFQTQALGTDGTSRTFIHDPEMVVGPNGG